MNSQSKLKRSHTTAIYDLLHTAKEHIQYPKIRLHNDALPIRLTVAGDKSRRPGVINISDGKPYGQGKYYGYIDSQGTIRPHQTMDGDLYVLLQNELATFAENPAGYAKLYGNATGECMFCARELTDPQSVAVGYGPICAEHYGLPHGDLEASIAEELTQFELEMPEMTEVQKEEVLETQMSLLEMPIEHQTAHLLRRIEQLEAMVYKMQTKGF